MFDAVNYGFMAILVIIFIYPFWDTLIISLSIPENTDIIGLRLFTWPVRFDAYNRVIKTGVVYIGYYNTIFRTIIGTSLTVIVTYFGAYALSKRELPLRTLITLFLLFTMFFSGGLIPQYLNISWLGLRESRWVLIFPILTSAWYLIITRNFIMTLPKELEDAATIDGANPIKMISLIMLPLSMPIIAVLTLWVSVNHWNAWFDCLLYIHNADKQVLQIILRRIMSGNIDFELEVEFEHNERLPRTVRAAAVMITIGPIILAYPFLQKYFVKGIFIGSLKG